MKERILEYIYEYALNMGMLPSYREIGEGVGLKSMSSLFYYFDKLIEEGEKTEMQDCFPSEVKNGEVKKMGCGGKKCVEVHFVKNQVTKEWQTAWGTCTRCGMKFMV